MSGSNFRFSVVSLLKAESKGDSWKEKDANNAKEVQEQTILLDVQTRNIETKDEVTSRKIQAA